MNPIKWIGVGLAAWATAGAAMASPQSPLGCASLVGLGFDTAAPAGYSECRDDAARPTIVESSGFQVSGDYAPYGTQIPYPVVYSGVAAAWFDRGILRASVTAQQLEEYVPFRGGEAVANIFGTIVLGTVGSGPQSRWFYVDVDGFIEGWGTYDVQLQMVRVRDPAVFLDVVSGSLEVEDAVDRSDYSDRLSVHIEGEGGDRFGVFMRLSVRATSNPMICGATGCTADFSHTAQLSLGNGNGAVYGYGGFLSQVAGVVPLPDNQVPEPASGALAMLGLLIAVRRSFPGVLRLAAPVAVTIGLAGCNPTNPMAFREEPVTLAVRGGEFKAMRTGCTIQRGEFTDRGGQIRSAPSFKFIAVSPEGKTIGEWLASCQAVAPNGSSDCKVVSTGSGNMLNSGGLSCPAFRNLQLISGNVL